MSPLARIVDDEEPFEFFAASIEAKAQGVRQPGDIDVKEYIALYRAKTGIVISDSTAIDWLNATPGVRKIERCYDPKSRRLKSIWRPVLPSA